MSAPMIDVPLLVQPMIATRLGSMRGSAASVSSDISASTTVASRYLKTAELRLADTLSIRAPKPLTLRTVCSRL